MAFDASRETLTDILHSLLHLGTHLQYIILRRASNADAQCLYAITRHLIACSCLIGFHHCGDILDTQLVVVVPLNQHIGDVIHIIKLIIHCHADAAVTIVIVTCITRLVLIIECLNDLGGHHPQVCHFILSQFNIDTLIALAIYLHTTHSVNITDSTFDEFRIVVQFLVTLPITLQCVKHSIHITEIISHLRCRGTRWQLALHIRHLTAKHVPLLLHILIGHSRE